MDAKIVLKRGQVTIFIILGVLLVFAIVVGLLLFNKKIETSDGVQVNPVPMVRECVKDSISESIGKIMSGGGLLDFGHFATYDGEFYNYLCYQSEDSLGCYNNYPALKSIIETNIRQDTLSAVQKCFDIMREDFESRGFVVIGDATTYSISVFPGEVHAALEKEITVSMGNSSISVKNFDTTVHSALYDLVEISRGIVNDESQYCTFDHVGHMFLYPEYDIKKVALGSGRIYSVSNRRTNEKFKFAVRSCPSPAGL
jgi:hypothetical protein